MSTAERRVLITFRQFRMSPGQMLCFDAAALKKHRLALSQMIEKGWLMKEDFNGAYSLTSAGFAAMKDCK